jgi:hypothetical protein
MAMRTRFTGKHREAMMTAQSLAALQYWDGKKPIFLV